MNKQLKALRAENDELEKLLSDADAEVQTDMVVYIKSAHISDMDAELVRRDITHMLLDGESRGVTANEVIGGDYKAFCDEVMSQIPRLTPKKRVMTAFRDVLPSMCLLYLIWMAFAVIRQVIDGEPWYITPIESWDVIIGIAILLIAELLTVYIMQTAFESNIKSFAVITVLILAVCGAAMLLIPKKVVFRPHIAADLALTLVMFAAYKFIDAKV